MSQTKKPKARILAVDDSRVMRHAMSKILKKNYEVLEAENGEDAWTLLLNDDSIQVVFTDLSMPFLDGYGLLERIRSSNNRRLSGTPVIIITGNDDNEEAKQEALDKGANDFITKPFDSIQLQARAKAHVTFKQTTVKLKETSDMLERQATVDETTGLGGQRYFLKVGDEILSYAVRHSEQFILIRIDIDGFNNLFLKYGKKVMDKVLQTIGQKLSQLVRQEDTISRTGVSKFAVILRETNMDEATLLTSRICKEIKNMAFNIPGNKKTIRLTLSAGLYEPELNSKLTFNKVMAETEKYLNKAISAGGNRAISHTTNKVRRKGSAKDVNITELLKKLNEYKSDELLSNIDSILYHITPLLKFLVENSGNKLQAVLQRISKK